MKLPFHHQGTVLILVLIITTLITVVVTSVMRRSLSNMQLLSQHQKAIQAEQANEAVIHSFLHAINIETIRSYEKSGAGSFGINTFAIHNQSVNLLTRYAGIINDYYIFRSQASTEINGVALVHHQGWRVNKALSQIETTDWRVGS